MGLNLGVLNKLGNFLSRIPLFVVPSGITRYAGLSSATTKQVYERHFKNKKTDKFEDFHIACVDFCKYFNMVMPGKDFDIILPREEIEKFFEEWLKARPEEQMDKFIEFMRENVEEAEVNSSVFIAAGLAMPVAAVVGKRASGHIPYVKSVRLDLVPNVVFVPLVTLVGIIGATALQIGSKRAATKENKDANEDEKKTKLAAEQQQQRQQQQKK